MGDVKSGPCRLSFDSRLRVEFPAGTVAADAGPPRELDERLGLSAPTERRLTDPCTGRKCQPPLPDIFRQSVYSLLAGYKNTNNTARLAELPLAC